MEALRFLPESGPPASLKVEVRKLSHAFHLNGEDLPVLDAVDLVIEPGEFVALIGPSGCGKSTLLRLLAGLERPTDGSLLAGGEPITKPDPSRMLVFQDPTLFPWLTVWRNVATGLEARGVLDSQRERVDSTISTVGLDGFSHAYPHQLSGGMAQRAALARALVNDPALLLLDEPLGKLDSLTRLSLQEELATLWLRKRFTALMVTHDVEEALVLASRVIVLSDRPARILSEIRVDASYPRIRHSTQLVNLRHRILQLAGHNDVPLATHEENFRDHAESVVQP